uniref:Uncharacterized protein n=1 Tax=Ditylenchus dipsaci TaxID=166011 RepID=A0A915CPF2_9BILA
MKLCGGLVCLLVLCLFSLCSNCWAKPTNSMTRIQQVFRTLMTGTKPMMFSSRGKKSVEDESIVPLAPVVLDLKNNDDYSNVPMIWMLPMAEQQNAYLKQNYYK